MPACMPSQVRTAFVFPRPLRFCLSLCSCLLAEKEKNNCFFPFLLSVRTVRENKKASCLGRSALALLLGSRRASSSAGHKCFCRLVPASSGIKKKQSFFLRSALPAKKKQFYGRTAKAGGKAQKNELNKKRLAFTLRDLRNKTAKSP